MFRGRFKHLLVATGASALVAAAGLAAVPMVASAAGSSPTSTTVVAKPASTTSGHQVVVTATVAEAVTADASTVRSAPFSGPTGTVTFTITGSHSGTASCKTSNTVTISKRGKAVCRIIAGQLVASDSPYSVFADYSGDSNFATSTGAVSVTVAKANTKTHVIIDSKPHDLTANSVTANVSTRHGGTLLTGTIVFSVSASPATNKGLRTCMNGGDVQPLVVVGKVGTASCQLPSGWFVISKVTPGNKHPHGSWNVTASYSGDSNFFPSVGTKSGHSKT